MAARDKADGKPAQIKPAQIKPAQIKPAQIKAVEIRDVDQSDADALVAWNELMRQGYNATREAAWWRSPEATVAQFSVPKPGRISMLLQAVVDGKPVGGAEAIADPGESVDVEISVLPEFRRKGVGRALALAVRGALPHPIGMVMTEVYEDDGLAFAKMCGLGVGNREVRQLLDWPLPDGELDELTRETPGVSIESWTGACPAEYVQHLARLAIQMDEDVDLGDLSRPTTATDLAGLRQNEQRLLAQGYLTLTSLAIVDGTPVGYTTLHVDRNWPEMVIQDDTLVDRDHRGKGIARILKLANLRLLSEVEEASGAKYVQTYTSLANEAMLALNAQVGLPGGGRDDGPRGRGPLSS